MKLKIAGYTEARRIINQGWPTKVISIVDYETRRLVDDDQNNITGIFWDTLEGPKKDILEPIFKFFDSITENDNVLIHCSAGISRSTATALALLLSKGFDYDSAIKIVYKARPQACPNDTVLKLYDDYSGLNGRLIKKYAVTKGQFISDFNNYAFKGTENDDLKMGFSDLLKSYTDADFLPTEEELNEFDNHLSDISNDILRLIKNDKT